MRIKNRVGEKYITNEGYEIEIIEYNSNEDIKVVFENGCIKNVQYSQIKKGGVKNPYHRSVFNVGYFGEGSYKGSENKNMTNIYNTWHGMHKRCYSSKCLIKHVSYTECHVAKEWNNFQNFAKWFENNHIKEFELDKDILVKGNKIYSSETCCFVPKEINLLFVKRKNKRGDFAIGVNKHGLKFQSSLSIGKGKVNFLGTFETELEAFNAYKIAKEDYIKEVADKWKEQITEKCYQSMYKYQVEITD